jgi:para-aminobenzoate synthetase/4-amino-4-deoxychorismate lyase
MPVLHPSAPFALFDDNLSGSRDLLLENLVETIACFEPGMIDDAFARIAAATRRGEWVALAAAYELGEALEPRLASERRTSNAPLLLAWTFSTATRLAPDQTALAIDAALTAMDSITAWPRWVASVWTPIAKPIQMA